MIQSVALPHFDDKVATFLMYLCQNLFYFLGSVNVPYLSSVLFLHFSLCSFVATMLFTPKLCGTVKTF